MRRAALAACAATLGVAKAFRTWDLQGEHELEFRRRVVQCESSLERASQTPEDFRVVLAQVVFRHGSRTPLQPMGAPDHHDFLLEWNECTPTDYHGLLADVKIVGVGDDPPPDVFGAVHHSRRKHSLKGNCKPGQLTVVGAAETVALGAELREQYVNKHKLIDGEFKPTQVRVRSTFMPRAVQSAQGVLRGLYGDSVGHSNDVLSQGDESSDGESGPRVDVFVMQREKETLIPHESACARLDELLKMAKRKFGSHEDEERVRALMAKHLSHDTNSSHIQLRDGLVSRESHALPLPEGWHDELKNKVSEIAAWQLRQLFHVDSPDPAAPTETLRLAIGRCLMEMVDNMHRRCENSDSVDDEAVKIRLFSAHDTTLVPLLIAMGVYDDIWPPFASHVAVELLERNGPSTSSTPCGVAEQDRFVRIIYNSSVMRLPACDGEEVCTLEQFEQAVRPFIPDDLDKECAAVAQVLEHNQPPPPTDSRAPEAGFKAAAPNAQPHENNKREAEKSDGTSF